MFFPERITLITDADRVLEVGPGGTPHGRANVLLEKRFSDDEEAKWQRGKAPELKTDKSTVFYDGGPFPFRDREFDYVICSHVLEHVPDVESFVQELFRVASKGYIEYPTIYYEYLYNIPVHINMLRMRENCLFYLPKNDTHLADFDLVQAFFLRSLDEGYSHLVDHLKPVMFEGFEWIEPFSVRKAASLRDLVPDGIPLSRYVEPTTGQRIMESLRRRAHRLFKRSPE